MNSKTIFLCTVLLAATSFLSCDDIQTNTPEPGLHSTITAKARLQQPRIVLPVKEFIEHGGSTTEERVLMLAGQVVYVITPVSNHNRPSVDVELLVELELGEELGWKIGGASIDRLEFEDDSKHAFVKHYLIDETDPSKTLSMLFEVDQMQLSIARIWVSPSRDKVVRSANETRIGSQINNK